MLWISPGKEEDFRYLQEWFAANAALHQVIEANEVDGDGMVASSKCCTDNALSRPPGSLRMSRV